MRVQFNLLKFGSANKYSRRQAKKASLETCCGEFSKIPESLRENAPVGYYSKGAISFKGYECTPGSFELKELYGINCPCCGKVMMTKKQADSFSKRVSSKKGAELEKELSKGFSFYRPNEEEIVNIIISKAEENPNLSLEELVRLQAKDSVENLESVQKAIIERMKKQAEKLDKNEKKKIVKVLDETLEDINSSSDENQNYKRKDFVNKIYKLHDEYGKENKAYDKILVMAEAMPASYTSADAFFVKYQRRRSSEIAQRLVSPAVSTTEHVQAKSKEGENNTDNYILMCGSCNSQRGDMPYNEWFEKHPEMPENLQKYVYQISEKIENGRFRDFIRYEDYCGEIIERVIKETDGELVLKMPKEDFWEEDSEEIKAEEEPTDEEETIDEKREIWLKNSENLGCAIKEYEDTKLRLEEDEEYQNIVAYSKENEALKILKEEKDANLASVSRLTGRRASLSEKIKKEKEGAANKAKLDALEEDYSNCASKLKAAKAKFNETQEKYNKQKEITDEIRDKIELPEDIQRRMQKVKGRIAGIQETKKRAGVLRRQTNNNDEALTLAACYLNGEIGDVQARIKEREEKFDLNSPENMETLEKYKILVKKQDMVRNVPKSSWKKLVANQQNNKNINSDFIYYEAMDSLNYKIDLLTKSEAVKQYMDLEYLKELDRQKSDLELSIEENETKKKELEGLIDRLQKEKYSDNTGELEKIYRDLAQRRQEVLFKFRQVNIDETIKSLKERQNLFLQKYADSFIEPDEGYFYEQKDRDGDSEKK